MEAISVDGYDVIVEVMDFPNSKVGEVVLQNSDGTYTILLNGRFNKEQQRENFEHAIGHIKTQDFDKVSVQSIEAEAHQKITPEEVCEQLKQEADERRRKRLERIRRKRQKRMKEYEDFCSELLSSSPNSYDSMQDNIIYRV